MTRARIGGLKERRFDELDMRVAALIGLGRLAEARGAAEELVAHAPDRSAGYAKLAAIERLLGNIAAALAYLKQAWEHEQDPPDALTDGGVAQGRAGCSATRRASQ